MFKVPDWGDDVPNIKVNFGKKTKKKDKTPTPVPDKSYTNAVKQSKSDSSINSPQNGIKKKKRKNKKQNQTNAEAPNKNENKRHVQKQINGEANTNIVKKNLYTNRGKSNSTASTNVPLSKKAKLVNKKLNKVKKRPQILNDTENGNDNNVSEENSAQSVPKKGKKRKRPTSDNTQQSGSKTNYVSNPDMSKAKKQKLDDNFTIDDTEDLLFGHNNKSTNKKLKKKTPMEYKKVNPKKERIKQILETQMKRTPIKTSGNKLRDRMLERLKAAQFRYINEKLYTSSGSEAQELFQNDPAAFHTYHEGYQLQVKKWPVNPLDVIVKRIQKVPKTQTIADMGCGEAALSKRIPHTVRSFDLVATAPGVEVCDIAHTPLLSASMDVAVYCLALMGTDLTQYLVEANRVLKSGGLLLIAEVESRFEKVEDFVKDVERLGFKLKNLDKTHQVFFFMEFSKIREPPVKKSKLPTLTLKPCLYKRR